MSIVETEIIKTLRDQKSADDFPTIGWDELSAHLASGYGEGYQDSAAKALIDFDYACAVEIVLNYWRGVAGSVPDFVVENAADDNLWFGQLMSILFEHLLQESKTYRAHYNDDTGHVSHYHMKKIRKEISYYMWDKPNWYIDDMFVRIPSSGKYVLKNF